MVSEATLAAERSIKEGIDNLSRLAQWFDDMYKRHETTLADLKMIQTSLFTALPADPHRRQ